MHRVASITIKNGHRFYAGIINGRFGVMINSRLTSSTPPTSSAASQVAVANRVIQEPFLNGSSSIYVEEMYKAWLKDPNSVHKSWDVFFRVSENAEPGHAYQKPSVSRPMSLTDGSKLDIRSAVTSSDSLRDIEDHLSVQAIIRSYQVCFYSIIHS